MEITVFGDCTVWQAVSVTHSTWTLVFTRTQADKRLWSLWSLIALRHFPLERFHSSTPFRHGRCTFCCHLTQQVKPCILTFFSDFCHYVYPVPALWRTVSFCENYILANISNWLTFYSISLSWRKWRCWRRGVLLLLPSILGSSVYTQLATGRHFASVLSVRTLDIVIFLSPCRKTAHITKNRATEGPSHNL